MPAALEEFENKVLRDAQKTREKAIARMKNLLLKIVEGKQCLEELRSEVVHYQKQCDQTNQTRDHTAPGVVEAACAIGGLFVGDPSVAVEKGVETLYDTLSEATTDFVDFVNTSIYISKSRDIVSDLQKMVDKLQSTLIKYKEAIKLLENKPEEQSLSVVSSQRITSSNLQTMIDQVEPAMLECKEAEKFLENSLKEDGPELNTGKHENQDDLLVSFGVGEIELVLDTETVLDMADHTLLRGILAGFCIKCAVENIGTLIHSWEDSCHPELEAIELVIEKLSIVEEVIQHHMKSMINKTPPDPSKDEDDSVSINDKFTRIVMLKETNDDDDGIGGDDALD